LKKIGVKRSGNRGMGDTIQEDDDDEGDKEVEAESSQRPSRRQSLSSSGNDGSDADDGDRKTAKRTPSKSFVCVCDPDSPTFTQSCFSGVIKDDEEEKGDADQEEKEEGEASQVVHDSDSDGE